MAPEKRQQATRQDWQALNIDPALAPEIQAKLDAQRSEVFSSFS